MFLHLSVILFTGSGEYLSLGPGGASESGIVPQGLGFWGCASGSGSGAVPLGLGCTFESKGCTSGSGGCLPLGPGGVCLSVGVSTTLDVHHTLQKILFQITLSLLYFQNRQKYTCSSLDASTQINVEDFFTQTVEQKTVT